MRGTWNAVSPFLKCRIAALAGLEDRASDMEMSLDLKRIKYCTALQSDAAPDADVAAAGAAQHRVPGGAAHRGPRDKGAGQQ